MKEIRKLFKTVSGLAHDKTRPYLQKISFLLEQKSKQRVITLRTEYGSPEENTEELKVLMTENFDKIRNRKEVDNTYCGRFFGIVLLIEAKLVQLLIKYEPSIDDLTFGRKIDVFKDFLRDLERLDDDFAVKEYRALVAPLKEIALIRNNMAHDLSYIYCAPKDLAQTNGHMKKARPALYSSLSSAPTLNDKHCMLVSIFGFYFSERTAYLVQIQK